MSDSKVAVRRQWNSHMTGTVEEGSLSNVHWSQQSGGVHARSPRPFLHAFMSCEDLLDGEIAHSCRHGECPHYIKVCITKIDNDQNVYKRLKAQAAQNLTAVARRLAREYPQTDEGFGPRLVKAGLFGDQLGTLGPKYVAGILLLALLTLAAACVNLAGMFAARSADRGKELAVRMAIGSSRWRVLRQVLAEAALLALWGGAAGAVFATWIMGWLSTWQPIAVLPVKMAVEADGPVYAAAVLLAAGSAVLPALLTARQILKIDAMQTMKSGAIQTRVGRMSARDLLLGLQVALCALLVTCALVGVRGLEHSLHAPLGVNPQGVMLAQSEMKMGGYSDQDALPLQMTMIAKAQQIPGVTSAASINEIMLNVGGSTTPVYRSDTTDFRSSNAATAAKFYTISPGYLKRRKPGCWRGATSRGTTTIMLQRWL